MDVQKYRRLTSAGVAFGVVFLSAGCATKKYVQNNIAPLEVKLDKTNKQVADNGQQIKDLDRKTESGIAQAQSSADAANQEATKAQQAADNATGLAQKGISEAEAAREDIENADNFQSVRKVTILFGFDKSKLTPEDLETLDSLAQTASTMKHYVIEVKGFTDNVGQKQYNLQLSRKRADAVVRYLTLEKQIPLVRVYDAGYGEDGPAAPNKTHDGRKQNRRVEVSILAPQMPGAAPEARGPISESQPEASASSPQQ
jgi:outer membrane protein OmpA-like peptidoglycan-associated protein